MPWSASSRGNDRADNAPEPGLRGLLRECVDDALELHSAAPLHEDGVARLKAGLQPREERLDFGEVGRGRRRRREFFEGKRGTRTEKGRDVYTAPGAAAQIPVR